jgi:hypothetical protein
MAEREWIWDFGKPIRFLPMSVSAYHYHSGKSCTVLCKWWPIWSVEWKTENPWTGEMTFIWRQRARTEDNGHDHFRSGASSHHWRHCRWKGPTMGIAKLPVAHNILPVPDKASFGHATSGHVTSGCSPLCPYKYDFVRTHILLMYLHLNNWEFCRVKSENMTLFMLALIF